MTLGQEDEILMVTGAIAYRTESHRTLALPSGQIIQLKQVTLRFVPH